MKIRMEYLIAIAAAIVLAGAVTGYVLMIKSSSSGNPAKSMKEGDEYFRDILIVSYGTYPEKFPKGSAGFDSSLWVKKIEKVVEIVRPDLARFSYPNGSVICHGSDKFEATVVQIKCDVPVDRAAIDEVYSIIRKRGEEQGIRNIPCRFFSTGIPGVKLVRDNRSLYK
jgi:hypothetical protein